MYSFCTYFKYNMCYNVKVYLIQVRNTLRKRVAIMLYSCCLAGHRPAGFAFGYNEEHPACLKIKQAIYRQITFLADNGVSCFLSGMAQGAELWAAELVLELKCNRPNIILACVLPCDAQANRWHESARARYRTILQQADHTHFTSRHYTDDCTKRRNQFLVDHSSLVLAVYNGNPQTGTAQLLSYAQRQGRPISIINPKNGSYSSFIL